MMEGNTSAIVKITSLCPNFPTLSFCLRMAVTRFQLMSNTLKSAILYNTSRAVYQM